MQIKYCLVIQFLLDCLMFQDLPGNITDFDKCKVSHLGIEYSGSVALTESKVRCQSWSATNPVHKIDHSYTDKTFPDESTKKAKSQCRNPSRDPRGPWCYTMDQNLINETCAIPLCSFTECKVTGPGMEYGGKHDHTMSDRKCLKWNKKRKRVKQNGTFIEIKKYEDYLFPEEQMKDAKKYCRNPNSDIGGPWCFVELEDSDYVQREYCDIPFCDDQDCMVFTKNNSIYSHYTDLDKKLANITFGIKIWDSDNFLDAYAKLILSVLALPINGKEMDDLGTGIELYLSNKKSALTYGNKGKPEYEKTFEILKSTDYTFFSLGWHAGFLTLSQIGETKPLLLEEYKIKNNLLGFYKNKFNYYSAQGTNILWSFPFCDDDGECDVHTTTTGSFQQFWPLRETPVGQDLKVYINGLHSAKILLVPSPTVDYPQTKIVFQSIDNFTRISVTEHAKGPTTVLSELQISKILDLWKWHEFSISVFANTLTLYWTKELGTHAIFELQHEVFRHMHWFSPSSDDNLVRWTFLCRPPDFAKIPEAWLPECALNANEPDYKGTQSLTDEGLPCVPWSGKNLLPDSGENFFKEENITEAWNYCRDPGKENKGTYCFAISQTKEPRIGKRYCHLRKCKSAECRMAGTGNDYIGKINITRSNRSCIHWINPIPTSQNVTIFSTTPLYHSNTTIINETTLNIKSTITEIPRVTQVHEVNPEYLNGSLYADMSVEKAENYCRNPSRNIAGSWCYTSDKKIEKDICNVRDCDKPEECIIITQGVEDGRNLFILPQWKETGTHGGLRFAVKEWNPDLIDGLIFIFKPMHGTSTIKLIIGAHNNEKVIVYHNQELIKEKTFPRLIPSGKWASFWLQIRRGEISLGYEGVPTALVEWKHEKPEELFQPMFLSYMSIHGNPIGIFFKCDECHTENTTTRHLTKIMPIGLWSQEEKPIYFKFTLKMRGTGVAIIPLLLLPESAEYYTISIEVIQNLIKFGKYKKHDTRTAVLTEAKYQNGSILTTNSWTDFQVEFTERVLVVKRKNYKILHYRSSEPLLFYWFSVSVENGWITWSANCEPLDIDGPPRDGGWSSWSGWQCTVSCGGGEGVRTRTCSNPRPNIFGHLCEGSSTSTGKCNDFVCGDISPNTMNNIRSRLQTQVHSLKIKEGGTVILKNDDEMLETIKQESAEAYYEWTKNGIFVRPVENHINFRSDDIHIKNVEISDTGTYVCMVYRINKQRVVLRVITLVVIAENYQITTRATLPLMFTSNAVVLGYIYSELSQKWLLNNTVYMDYGITTLAAVSAIHINSSNMSHTGEWQCVVEQKDLKLMWITNYIKVNVKSKPNLYTHLMEDHLTAPLFGWLKTERNVLIGIIFIIIFVVVLVSTCLWLYLRWGRLPTKKKYKRLRQDS